nr:hypothetical protein [Allomuricauda sp.]
MFKKNEATIKLRYMKYFRLMFTLPFLSVVGLLAQTSGQLNSSGAGGNNVNQLMINSIVGDINSQYDRLANSTGIDDFQGSPYLNESFEKTELYYKDDLVGSVFYRYNAYNEEVETKENLSDKKIMSLNRDKELQFEIKGKKTGFKTFIDENGNTLNGYLISVYDGEAFDLYKRINVKFTEGQKAYNSFVKAIPNRFAHFEEYYLKQAGENRYLQVPSRKSKFLKLFNDQKKEKLKKLIKENNMDIKSTEDLVSLLKMLEK